jgi:uncharacterized damage-inducible protein DinB
MELYTLYPEWKTRTNKIIQSLSDRTPYELSFRHRSDMRTLGNLYRHIIAAESFWMEDIVAGRGNMYAELDDEKYYNAKSIIDKCQEVRARTIEIVKSFQPSDLKKTFTNSKKRQFTLEWILWHIIEHEIHHSGQISQMLRYLRIKSPIA